LAEDHVPVFTVERTPLPDPTFHRPTYLFGQLRMLPSHLLEDRDRSQPRRSLEHRHDLGHPGLLGSNINVLTIRYHGPITLGLMTLALLMFLTWLLPHWVTPWLESNVTFDAEADLGPTASAGGTSERPATAASSIWIRTVWNILIWILILLVILWIFSSYVPGGLRAMFH
jgi:hypothetical protein